jgi:hypothetical protein
LKAKIGEPEEASFARQQLGKEVFAVRDMQATVFGNDVFCLISAKRL